MIVVDECSTTFDQSNPAPPKRGRAHDQPESEFSFRSARLLKPIAPGGKHEPSPWSGYLVPVLGSARHCPADRKLFSGKSSHITPADDTWLARLLRRRLEQDVHETPPEWFAWVRGFGWRDPEDPKSVLHDWAQMPLHMFEKGSKGRDYIWRPDTRRKTGREKTRMFFDVPFEKQPENACRCGECRPWRFHTTEQSNLRFEGVTGKEPFDCIVSELKNAAAFWVYPLDRYEIDSREVDSQVFPPLVDGGCVHTILHKINGMNIKQHGLTGWVRQQEEKKVAEEKRDRETTRLLLHQPHFHMIIDRGKEYKNLHPEEAEQVLRSHTIKSKRNTGGPRPEGAIEDKDEYLQWMCDKGEARERTDEEVEEEFADRLKELQRIDDPINSFAQPAGPLSGMEWDGDSFNVNDDHTEYFEGRIIPERKRLTGAQRAAEFNDHKALVEAGAVVNLREDEFILDIKLEYITREEGAEKLGISVDALDKRIQRRSLEARAMQDGKFQIPYVALTYEQAADIADNNAVYLQVDLNGWRWYKLDVEKHGTVDRAIEALKFDKMWEALRQRKQHQAAGKHGTNERYPGWTIALKEVKDRYDKQVFHPDRIRVVQRPPRPKQPWEGLIGAE